MTVASATHALRERPLWVRVNSTLAVGSSRGEFLGTVERTTAGFVAVNGRGEPAGLFATERRAQQALTTMTGVRMEKRRDRMQRVEFAAATGAGAVAVTLALTAGALAPMI
ncbi:MAG TPA: hypothetical protein VEX42_08720 [Microbacterium sp.]|nr:hypothetical protein [Microbacterium sp.]